MKIKLEHIDNLRRGKKSGAKIGSREIPHHLYQYEEVKYTRALKNKYLEITNKERVNLRNLWEKVCIAKEWENYILVKDTQNGTAEILHNFHRVSYWKLKDMKQSLKELLLKKYLS